MFTASGSLQGHTGLQSASGRPRWESGDNIGTEQTRLRSCADPY